MYRQSIASLMLVLGLIAAPCYAQQAAISWIDTSSGTAQEEYFVVERRMGQAGSFFDIAHPGQDTQLFLDTQVIVGNEYCYRILARNVVGDSAYSNTACAMIASVGVTPAVMLGCVYAPTPPYPPSLVLALALDEASGAAVTDSSGQGNNGMIGGATRTASGKYGGALVFDGVNDWVTVPDANSLDLTTAMTVEAWVFPTATSNGWRDLIVKEASGGATYYLVSRQTVERPSFLIVDAGTEYLASGSAALALNTWSHVAGTYDGVTVRLYINGVLVASTAHTGAATVSTAPLRIGGNSSFGEFFQGRIDEVRIYNRALTASEITTDMNLPIPSISQW